MPAFQDHITASKTELLLLISFTPFLIKAVQYLMIGSLTPILVFLLLGIPMFYIWMRKPEKQTLILKTWAVIIMLWALIRFGIMILFLSTSVQEAHIESQFTVWFVLTNLFYLYAGFIFFKGSKQKAA